MQRDEADFRDSYNDEGPRRAPRGDAPSAPRHGHKNPNSKFHWANKKARSGNGGRPGSKPGTRGPARQNTRDGDSKKFR
jgi:hypothetical protein